MWKHGRELSNQRIEPSLAVFLEKNKSLQNEKTGDITISENVSGDVEHSGLEPLTPTLPALCSTN
jgi:hypothetical protein